MKKIAIRELLIVLTVFLMGSEAVNGQILKSFEGEVFGGITVPLSNAYGMNKNSGGEIGFEVRYNFAKLPVDVGLQWKWTSSCYTFQDPIVGPGGGYQELDATYQTKGLFLYGDYNFRRGKKVCPFLGVGLGYGVNNTLDFPLYEVDRNTAVFAPRAGVELWHFLRLTANMNISRNCFHNATLSVGFVLGGK